MRRKLVLLGCVTPVAIAVVAFAGWLGRKGGHYLLVPIDPTPVGVARAQPPLKMEEPPRKAVASPPTRGDKPHAGFVIPDTSPPAAEPKPALPDLNRLVEDLEQLRVQKSALEKREQSLILRIREAVEAQEKRLKGLGIAPRGPFPQPLLDGPPPAATPQP